VEKIAIVILNYNGRGYLEKFLPSLVAYSNPYAIYVADNASTDDSVVYVRDNYADVKILELSENYGYAGGYNVALNKIDAEYFILINSDVEVTEGWVSPLLETIEGNPDVVACQPKILAYHERDHFEYAGAAGGFIDWLGYPFCRGRLFDNLEKDQGQYDRNSGIFWASGACFIIKKEIFHAVGEFDKEFFAHMEEIDLCWRIQNSGYQIRYCHESVIYHVGGGTLSSNNPKKTYLNFRNGLFLLVKNLPFWQLIFKLPIRSVLDFVAAVKFILDGNSPHALSVLKAHLHAAIPSIKYVLNAKSGYKTRHKKYIYDKLIVFQYFIKNKKKFSDIKFSRID